MIKSYGNDIKCPFFKYINVKNCNICCEGLYDGCQSIQLCYKTKKDLNKQIKLFCEDKYEYCEVYRMIVDSKY